MDYTTDHERARIVQQTEAILAARKRDSLDRLRDEFAMAALPETMRVFHSRPMDPSADPDELRAIAALACYEWADAMLAERARRAEGKT